MTINGRPAVAGFNDQELDGFALSLLDAEQILRRECLEHIGVIHKAMHDRDHEKVPMTVETRVKVIKFCFRSGNIDQLLDYLKPSMTEPLRVALWQVKSSPRMRMVMEDLPEIAEWMLARWTSGREQRLNDMLEEGSAEAPAPSRRQGRL